MAALKTLLIVVVGLLLVACSQPDSKTLSGKPIKFSHYRGHWVYINYWADWCKPCTEEIPQLNQFYKSNKNVKVFAVNFDKVQGEQLAALVKKYKIAYPSLLIDPASKLDLGEIPGLPVTFVIDPKGKLYKTLYGPQTIASLDKVMRRKASLNAKSPT